MILNMTPTQSVNQMSADLTEWLEKRSLAVVAIPIPFITALIAKPRPCQIGEAWYINVYRCGKTWKVPRVILHGSHMKSNSKKSVHEQCIICCIKCKFSKSILQKLIRIISRMLSTERNVGVDTKHIPDPKKDSFLETYDAWHGSASCAYNSTTLNVGSLRYVWGSTKRARCPSRSFVCLAVHVPVNEQWIRRKWVLGNSKHAVT